MKAKRFGWTILAILLLIGAYAGWVYYQRIFAPNVLLNESSNVFYIHSDWEYQAVKNALKKEGIVQNIESFDWVSKKKQYPSLVKSGRYVIPDGLNNNQLVNLLRSGEQEPVQLLLRSVRSKEQLAGNVDLYIEADSAALLEMLRDPAFCDRYGFNPHTILTMFLPNTYEFYWDTDEDEFIVRMAREYKRFWTDERIAKAKAIGLTQSEVTILASIVQAEQAAHPDERPVVAGLYLNRLRKGMRLESDPTLIHAIGDYKIKRVLHIHKEVDSPFNTYRNAGLPPGPILLPEITSIDAVLNASKNNYLFMCAKEDFSGYHNFSSSYREHINNAKRYQRALNDRKIYR